jgi:hypothetical protein
MSEVNPATTTTSADPVARDALAAAPSPKPAPPRTLAHVTGNKARPVPRARPYLRLLWLIPSAAILAVGLYGYMNYEPGGTVESVKLTTKPGPVGQASEALRLITSTPDLFLKVKTKVDKDAIKTQTYKDMAIGNGLVWSLPHQYKLGEIIMVDVWDEHTFRHDQNLDHIAMNGQWWAEGQTFHLELLGKQNEPPKWALPTLTVGATLSGLVILRFIWDQVV